MIKPDETTSAKLVVGGTKIPLASLGFQGGSFLTLILLAWLGQRSVEQFVREAEDTREAVEQLGGRLDKVDTAIAKLSENAAEIDRLAEELAEARLANAALAAKIAAVDACARDKRKC